MIYPSDPPEHDTLELSVFGKGVGESIVVHLGAGEWLVVDSLFDREANLPAALAYLHSIGVDVAKDIKLVVVTHWHRDHTDGISQIFRAAPMSELVLSLAVRCDEFRELLGLDAQMDSRSSSMSEMRRLLDLLNERKNRKAQIATPKWAGADRLLLSTPTGDVYSLSPSDAAITLALDQFKSLIPTYGAKTEFVWQNPNDACVVLSIRYQGQSILLGADLECGADPTRGWKAILGSSCRHPPADALKVPHHGSKNADDPRAWARFAATSPIAVLTPYRALRNPLPTQGDLDRLISRTDRLYCAGSRAGVKASGRSANVQKLIAGKVHSIEGRLGQVRVRFPLSGSSTIETFGAAEQMRSVV